MKKSRQITKKIISAALALLMVLGTPFNAYAEDEYIEDSIDIESTKDSYMVYKDAPYDGEYLIMTNAQKDYSNNVGSVGVLPDMESVEEYSEDIDFDEDIMGYDENGVGLVDPESALPELIVDEDAMDDFPSDEEIQSTDYYVGYTKTLKLQTGSGTYSNKTCVCMSVGDHCTVWTVTDDPIYVNYYSTMVGYMNDIRDNYESMYINTVNAFGDLYYADYYGDKDGKVAFICYDIQGDGASNAGAYMGGYFFGADLNVPYSNATGNNMDCLHIDSYQGMCRSGNSLRTSNIYRTLMHELQHMIMWSNLRKSEINNGITRFSLNDQAPSWLNEGFSEAASHLCYGYDSGRISIYNNFVYGGNVSLTGWASGSIYSYSVSYLFSQYIRTLYAQKTGTDGWTIYNNAVARVNKSTSLFDAIAAELGYTPEELIENFWIANFMLNNEGPYGYNGEAWAENIKQKVTTSPASFLYPGASQVVSKSTRFTPSNYSSSIKFAGLSKTTKYSEGEEIGYSISLVNSGYGEKTFYCSSTNASNAVFYYTADSSTPTRNSSIMPSGGLTITKVGTTNLRILATASGYKDTYKSESITISKLPSPVINAKADDSGNLNFTISDSDTYADIYYVINGSSPTANGTKYNGTGVVYPYSSFSKIQAIARRKGYADSNVVSYSRETVSEVPMNYFVDSLYYGGHTVKLLQKNGETITYTTDGSQPTKSSAVMPINGIRVTKEGTTTITVTGWKEGYLPKTKSYTVSIRKLNAPTIVKSFDETTQKYNVTIKDNGPAGDSTTEIYYAIDDGAEVKYTAAFQIDGSSSHTIKAYAKRLGDIQSGNSSVNTAAVLPVELGDIIKTPIYGGYQVTVTAESGAEVRYTTDGSVPVKSSNLFPEEGIGINKQGSTTIKIKAWKDGCIPVCKTDTINLNRVAAPTASSTWMPNDCEYSVSINNAAANPDADIFYAIDGGAYKQYTGAFVLTADKNHSVVAFASKKGYINSEYIRLSTKMAETYTPKDIIATPVYGGYVVSVNDSDNTVVYRYTLDGSEPDSESELWPADGKITISTAGKTTVKVKAWKNGYFPGSKSVSINIAKLLTPVVTASLIDYLNEYKISIVNINGTNTEIAYSVDDSLTENFRTYSEPFNISAGSEHKIYAYSRKKGYISSNITGIDTEKVEQVYYPLSGVPRVPVTSLTVNKKTAEGYGTQLLIMPIEGEEVYECSLTGNKSQAFIVNHVEDDDWVLELTDKSIPAGTYKLDLNMRGTPFADEPAKTVKLNVRVVDTKPTVSLKRISMNKYYSDSIIPLELTSKDGKVNVIGLKNDKYAGFTNNFSLKDTNGDGNPDSIAMNGGYSSFVCGSNKMPVLSGLLTVNVDGYQNQDIPVTVSFTASMPRITQTVTSPKYNYELFVKNNLCAVLNYQIVNGKDTIILDNYTNVGIDVNSRSYSKVSNLLDSTNPVEVDENGNVKIRFRNPGTANIAGTYTVPLVISANTVYGKLDNISINAKFTIDKANANIKVNVGSSTLKLNKQVNDYVYTQVTSPYSESVISDVVCTAATPGRRNNFDEYVKLRYNSETSCLEAYYDNYSNAVLSTCTTYNFNCVPVLKNIRSGEEVEASQSFAVTVSIIDKAPTVTTTAKGSVCVLNRDSTTVTYTVKKNNLFSDFDVKNNSKPIVVIASPTLLSRNEIDGTGYLELTENYSDQFAGNGTVSVKLKDGVEIRRGQKYVIRLGFLLKNGDYLYSPNIKITPVQSTVKVTQDKKPVLYKSVNMRKRTDTINLCTNLGEIESVSLNGSKNSRIPAGLKYELSADTTGKLIIKLNDSSVRAGDYTINLDVVYKGEMVEINNTRKTFPVTVKVTVK